MVREQNDPSKDCGEMGTDSSDDVSSVFSLLKTSHFRLI